jgi:hypothetical protein
MGIRHLVVGTALALVIAGCTERSVEEGSQEGTASSGHGNDEGASSAEAGDGSGGDGSAQCEDPEPMTHPVTGEATGYVRCADGFIHRAGAIDTVITATPEPCESSSSNACSTHDECTAAPLGRCVDTPSVLMGCECVYSCESDGDCDPGQVCVGDEFTGDVPRCAPAGCAQTGDCGDGLCGLAVDEVGCGERSVRLACMSAVSDCRMDNCMELDSAQCQYGDPYRPECLPMDGAWTCVDRSCAGNCG